MPGEIVVTLEWALGVAAALLAVRLLAMRRAERALPAATERIREAVLARDVRALRSGLRGAAGLVPFGDWASDWLWALDGPAGAARDEALDAAHRLGIRRIVRRAARGQALDLTALAVLAGLGTFASAASTATPWFWGLGGLLVLLLVGSVVLRGALGHAVRTTLEVLRGLLREHELGGEGEPPASCERCGGPLVERTVVFREEAGEHQLAANACERCGTWVGTLPEGAWRKPSP